MSPVPHWSRVTFADPLHGRLYGQQDGEYGTPLTCSDDGGATWQPTPITEAVMVETLRVNHVWAVRRDRWDTPPVLSRSHDGGRTWESFPMPSAPAGYSRPNRYWVSSLDFVDAERGWGMLLESGDDYWAAVIRTQDGGETWEWPTTFVPVGGPVDLSMANASVGWVTAGGFHEGGRICHTADGSLTWTPEGRPGVVPLSVQALSPTQAVVLAGIRGKENSWLIWRK